MKKIDTPSKTDKLIKVIDEKLKIKNIFATYILTATLFLGSYAFRNGGIDLTDPKVSYFILYVWVTIAISVAIYLVAGPLEFKQEDLKDRVRHEKQLRDPRTLNDIIESEFKKIQTVLEGEKVVDKIKADTVELLGKANPDLDFSNMSKEELEEKIRELDELDNHVTDYQDE